MTKGGRIRFVRTFRGMTQKELGIKLGFNEKNADIRISQYESDYRIPKEDMLRKMAEILDVSYNALKDYTYDNPVDVMESFFWFDTEHPMEISLFEFKPNKELKDNSVIEYPDNGNKFNPIGIVFALSEYRTPIKEWQEKKQDYHHEKITKEEYIEWKLQWNTISR